ncbi:MAG: hypothetical protein NT178_16570, partial [Proteobacteria bacterium]|nr:hypothetical protein [Pseudomonadota bacterium]
FGLPLTEAPTIAQGMGYRIASLVISFFSMDILLFCYRYRQKFIQRFLPVSPEISICLYD